MKWKPVDQYCVVSECGRYTISRAVVEDGHVYTAWAGKTAIHYERCADEAGERAAARKVCMQVCEDHAQ